jgi:acetoin utilization deacetylase AcuC-like enzyme
MKTKKETDRSSQAILPSFSEAMLHIAFSPVYKYQLPPGHRFPMEKYELIPEQLLYEGSISEAQFFHPQQLTDQEILSTHTPEYLDKLNNLTLSRREIRDIGFPVRSQLIERGKYIAHGTYDCALHALNYGVSMNVAGGTHHAYAHRGEGFCVFNDFALASNLLLNRGLVYKILVVDLDVHQGNGTAHIFQNDNRVFTFSMHGERNYPLRKEQSDLDIGLPDGTEDEYYLKTLKNTLPALIEQIEPDLIFYLSGVDILDTDKLGRLSCTKEGCKERDRYVLELCKLNKIPVAVSMGGGYSHRVADVVDAHCNTFRVAQEVFF